MMSKPEPDCETPDEKHERRLCEAAEKMKGFVKKASGLPRNRPRRPTPALTVWDRIAMHGGWNSGQEF